MKNTVGILTAAMGLVCVLGSTTVSTAPAACVPTGFNGLTAAMVNPGDVMAGWINAAGCDMGIYYSGTDAKVESTTIFGARSFGILVNGDGADTNVDILTSHINTIGDTPQNGSQRGVAIYYRAFFSTGTATGRVAGNFLSRYQKGGIVVNGPGSNVQVQNNELVGHGPVGFIAQNGIQFGFGSGGSAMRNTVIGHSYTGTSTVSGGIIVVGGAGYGTCPDGSPCAYTTGIQIVQNTLVGNDIGIFLTNLRADFGAPDEPTNIKAVNNTISNDALTNNYGGFGYQAGVSDVGNNDKIITNKVSGAGYGPNGSAYTVAIDADISFTNRPKVHANK